MHAFLVTTEADRIAFLQVWAMSLRELKGLFKVTQLVVEPGGELSNSKAYVLDQLCLLCLNSQHRLQNTVPTRGDQSGQRVPFQSLRFLWPLSSQHDTYNSKINTHGVEPTGGGQG